MDTIEQKLEYLKKNETGFITDALMLLKLSDCWMEDVYPLKKGTKFIGTAFTTRIVKVGDTTVKSPYEGMMDCQLDGKKIYNPYEIIDICPKGSVWVIGGAGDECIMGEHGYRSAHFNGITAMVMEGRCRDNTAVAEGPMPMYCRGVRTRIPVDFKWTDVNATITCSGAKVKPGDIVMGDDDGVVVIPYEYLDQVIYFVEKIAEIESKAEKALDEHASPLEVMEIIRMKGQLHL